MVSSDHMLERKQLTGDILKLSWPSVVELTLTSLLGMMDMVMVGRISAQAVSAVSITQQPVLVSMVLFQSFNVGGTALAARFIGQGRADQARRVTSQVMLLNLFFAVLLSALEITFARELVLFMGAKADYLEQATVYMRYASLGICFMALPSGVTALLRAAGNTRIPMRYNTVANLINVLFNALLIYGIGPFPEMGVAGAGLATVIGHATACAISLAVILRRSELSVCIRLRDLFQLDLSIIRRMVRIGFPTMLEQVIMRIAMISFTKLIASIGTVEYAAHSLSTNVQSLSLNISMAFGLAATSLVGRSLGAKRSDLAEAYVHQTRKLGLMVSCCIACVMFFCGRYVAMLFTGDERIIETMVVPLRCLAFIMIGQTTNQIVFGALKGAGDTLWPMIATLVSMFTMRIGLATLLVNGLHMGLLGAWLAFILDQFTRAAIIMARFRSGRWKRIQV